MIGAIGSSLNYGVNLKKRDRESSSDISSIALKRVPSLNDFSKRTNDLKDIISLRPTKSETVEHLDKIYKECFEHYINENDSYGFSAYFKFIGDKFSDDFVQKTFKLAVLRNRPEIFNTILENQIDKLSISCLEEMLISSSKDSSEAIVLTLSKNDLISTEWLEKILIKAVDGSKHNLVKAILKNDKVSNETLGIALIKAVRGNKYRLVESILENNRIPSESLGESLIQAINGSKYHLVKSILKNDGIISSEYLEMAINLASHKGHMEVIELIKAAKIG